MPEALSQCLSGYPVQKIDNDSEDEFVATSGGVTVKPEIIDWLNLHRWPQGYDLWKRADACAYAADSAPNAVCTAVAGQQVTPLTCTDKQASLDQLTTYRYMLQTMRAVWPYLDKTFKGWRKFPALEDYPEPLQNRIHAWPDEVLRSAKLADSIHMLPHSELLARWPSEADLAHWLLCGSDEAGVGVDAVYGAMVTNGVDLDAHMRPTQINNLEHYIFWQAHGWLERVWDKYRMRIGKMPHEPALQAKVLRQCQFFQNWLNVAAKRTPPDPPATADAPLFSNGYLNALRTHQSVRLLGEVLEMDAGDQGLQWLQVDLKRIGVKPVWVYSPAPLVDADIQIGTRYVLVGSPQLTSRLKVKLPEAAPTNLPTVLVMQSIQTPK